MAKTGSIERNENRKRLAQKYANRRAKLKATALDESLPPEERFEARLKLAQLPRNSAPNTTTKSAVVITGVSTLCSSVRRNRAISNR